MEEPLLHDGGRASRASGRTSQASDSEPQEQHGSRSTRLAHVMKLWDETAERGHHSAFFEPVGMAKDGGLGDITPEKLLYPAQYMFAAMSILFILLNVVYITGTDSRCVFLGECTHYAPVASDQAACVQHGVLRCSNMTCISSITEQCGELSGVEEQRTPFLLSRWLLFDAIPGERLIAVLELVALWGMLFRTVRLSIQASCATLEVFRWISVVQIFWQGVPSLSCFSLMRLLYYVTPAVIGTEAYYVWAWMVERIQEHGFDWHSVRPFVWYVVTRLFCVIVGFDAFLVKFRLAASSVVAHDNMKLHDILATVLFLFQMLGVVNLTWFVRERLFLFIFGMEDGKMTNAQKAREVVWNAVVAREIYLKLGVFRFVVVMLGFDDYDFQVLVMEDRPPLARCPAGHELRQRRTPLPQCNVCLKWFAPFTPTEACSKCNFDACGECKSKRLKESPFDNLDELRAATRDMLTKNSVSWEEYLLDFAISS
mmetsp:Transcript_6830/g.20153  ORF Transcript_6830/g.20153 Transcript_6830/m.20153 type:complete len:484 (+) Transcript_6830:45-1496(+)